MMSEKDIYAAALRAANVETKAKYFMTWEDPENGRSFYSVVTVKPHAFRGQLDKINLCTVKMDEVTQNMPISVTDAASLTRINVDNVKVVHQIVCADDNLEMLYKFDATNKIGKILDKNRYIVDKLARYKKMVKEGMEQMLRAELAEAKGKKRDREAKSSLEEGCYRDLTEWQIAKRAMIDDKDAERSVDRLDRVAGAAAAALMSLTGDSMDGTPPPTPTY